ncbi:hypothetical protein [Polynucleobacter sp. UK-Gri1-W3]|uniref:hypothetical protein n=1 Tax=Polynucleobacter sp. UK-Gri1-W3 TaxID=1819737 RepID=UPI001C0CB696|nr:hypothetical protein [Polynucleobacter sp. UK-Gri1-W3]MBU3538687.1 hypothetical protein [Polynucleobacter sp. UK-Gri1-W3]
MQTGPDEYIEPDALIKNADALMYEAKQSKYRNAESNAVEANSATKAPELSGEDLKKTE